MSVAFTKLTFVDGSTAVPLNAANLNALENAVNTLCVGGTGSGVAANTVTTAATTTSGTCYPVLSLSASGELQMYSSTNLSYVPSTGILTTKFIAMANTGATAGVFNGIQGNIGDNDFWFVGGSQTASNAGYMEIATGDDGAEPIYVRQYTGVPHNTPSTSGTITRTATLLDASGNTSFPGTLTASTIQGTSHVIIPTADPGTYTNGEIWIA